MALRLEHQQPLVCEAALRFMAAAGDVRHAERIHAQLARPTLTSRCAAIHVLAELGIEAAVEDLLAAIDSPAPTEVRAAMAALSRLRARQAVPQLITQLESADPDIEESAIAALGELGGEDALQAVQEKLQDASERARRAAATALFRRSRAAQPYPTSAATRRRLEKLRGDAVPLSKDNLGVAIRFALEQNRPYDELELTQRIARVCTDYSATRRHLIEQGLMTRQGGRYDLTEFGRAVWRVEHHILQHYPFPQEAPSEASL